MADPSERQIAVVGIGCRLPGGVGDPGAAARLFLAGRDVVGPVPADRYVLPATTRSGKPVPAFGAFVDGVDRFDAALFGISAREAAAMDPQQRLLLACAWAALEDAGVPPDRLDGSRTGTFVGLGLVDWARRTVWSGDPDRLDAWAGTGAFDAVAAGRIAYTFGLRGPALALHTACSASHVALHTAIRSLRSGEVDLALAGGAHLDLAPEPTVLFAELGALSPTGRCRTFDAAADGYVRGEGVGLFALMRLRDALDQRRRVYAVLEGSAVNHDGRTNGLTAPSARAQAEVLQAALDDARWSADEVGFVEAHGTGTPLGDPVEIEALAAVYGRGDAPLHVSSAKTLVGHLEAAAGVAGLLRAITALRSGSVPPHLHLRHPNPRLALAGTRLRLGGSGAWTGGAGVSGFGLSGTNAHLVVSAGRVTSAASRSWPVLVTLSAHDEETLQARAAPVDEDAERWAHGASTGRALQRWRAFRVLRDPAQEGPWVAQRAGRPPGVAFVVPSAAEPRALRWAARYPVFDAALRAFDRAWVASERRSVVAALEAGDLRFLEAPAAFAWGHALTALLAACGVHPEAWVGPGPVGLPLDEALERLLTGAPSANRYPDVAAVQADGFDAVVDLGAFGADPAALLPRLGELFVQGVPVDPDPTYEGQRDEVPVYPFRPDRHWLAPVGDPPVEVDFAVVSAPVGTGSAAGQRVPAGVDAAFAMGAAACARWSGPAGPLVAVAPGCPEDVAARVASALPPGVDEVWVDAAGRATTERVSLSAPPLPGGRLDPDRPVLVVGGTGYVGRHVVAALAARGARTFEVWSRRAPTTPWPEGLTVTHRSVDLAGPLPPVDGFQGAVHAGGDAAADEVAARAVRERVVAALDAGLRGPGAFLVVVGSIAARWGSPGLETYAGAQRAAEQVLAARTADGHAGAVVLAGPVSGGGLVSEAELAAFAHAGVEPVSAARVAEVVAAAVSHRGGPVGVGRVDWSRLVPLAERTGRRGVFDEVRPAPVARRATTGESLPVVLAVTAKVLGRASVEPDQGFFDAGLDSALAVLLARTLGERLGRVLPDPVVFDHPTPRALAAWLDGADAVPARPASESGEPIAIIGFAGRFPGADSPEALWELLVSGRDPLGPVPADRWDPADWPLAPREGGFVDAAGFDAEAFGIGPAEAAVLDPQQRLLLEVTWTALERAGLAPDQLEGRRGSVHVGIGRSEYWDRVRDPEAPGYVFSGTGNESSFAAGRLAHLLGLRGEALAVNTACSSSLVALHLACRALRAGEADLALAGGVNVLASPEAGTVLQRMGALSPTHRCHTFDARADGYVRSEGCGMLVLERLSDARRHGHRVHAVLRGSAVGHDGRSAGLAVPSGPAQVEVLQRALADAGLQPDDLDVVGVHGTGTPLGDPIEVGALAVVHAARTRPLALSALKSRLGHLETASGVAAVIATVLALAHGQVPPDAAVEVRNPRLPAGPFSFATALAPWPGAEGRPRRAGVSSFGISGTDAHVILEQGDPAPAVVPGPSLRLASGPTAKHAAAAALDLPAALAWHGRAHRAWRVAWSAGSAPPAPVRARQGLRVGFVVPGQGSQVPAMGRLLAAVGLGGALDALTAPWPELRAVLAADDDRIHDTRFTQPALVAVALVLGDWLRSLGLSPVVALGHSVGELAAAALAGHFDPAEALAFAVHRGALVADAPRDGGMVAVAASAAVVEALLVPGTSLAAVNADDETVVSGFSGPLDQVAEAARAQGLVVRPLRTSHAFHGPPMDPLLPALRALVPAWRPVSASGFRSASPGLDPADPEHWVRHLRAPVAFAEALRAAPPVDVWVELGVRAVASGLVLRVLPDAITVPLLRTPDPAELLLAAGTLWAHGAPLDLGAVLGPAVATDAPTTPFLHTRAWVDLPRTSAAPLPCHRVAWVPATPGALPTGEVHQVPVADVAGLLALARATPPGTVVVRADGVWEGTDPARAAVGGAFASWCAEHPDRDLRLFDGVPDDGVEAALRAGSPRVRWVDGPRVPRLEAAEPGPALGVRGTWVVSGGDGALGREVARWLTARGARVEVWARSRGVDVADRDQVQAAAAALAARGEAVAGVFHAAGVAHGALAHLETADGMSSAWATKVDGARHLLEVLPDGAPFVAASSAVAWLGLEGQAAYGAANAGLEALVRARGPSAAALAFGPFTTGLAAGVEWAGRGVRRADAARGAAVLGALPVGVSLPVVFDAAETAPAPALQGVPAAARPDAALQEVLAVAKAVLGRDVDPDVGFADAGADSLAAVELSRRLARTFGGPLPATLVFEHPTPRAVATWLLERLRPPEAPPAAASTEHDDIAIVGMSCRFPGAPDPEALWKLLAAGQVAVGPVPPERWDADAWFTPFPGAPGRSYVREGGFLPDPEAFDPEAFGLSPREATSLDPQQRLLLEVSREALEDAGHLGPDLAGSRTGVFVGIADRGWLHARHTAGAPLYPDAWAGTGNEPSFAAGRVAFTFGLRGEVMALNTTCSSTLVAVHHAVQALRRGSVDRALAGGVAMMFLPDDTAYLCAMQALSPTHRCHTFDARADGYVRSEGCGVFVLTRLADAVARGDRVLGIVRGVAVNHDGASSGLTVPNGAAQEAVLRAALADARVAPADVAYLETHGTGTRLGDPIESRAVAAVYGADRASPLWLGAVKSNLGHTELAAGAASLAKVLLMARHGRVPGQPGLGELNPELDLRGAEVVREARPWPAGARYAAVSGFGLSGTNAHLVLELPAPREVPEPPAPPAVVLRVSASSRSAAQDLAAAVARSPGSPAGLAAALALRLPRRFRAAVVAGDRSELRTLATTPVAEITRAPKVAFLCSGQGSQVAGMGLALDAVSPTYRRALDDCAAVLDPLLGRPLRKLLADAAAVDRTEYTQPLVFAVSWATAALLGRCGVQPAVVAGHSLGELVAATLAGVWTLPDALALVVARGRGMADRALPGAMAAVSLPASVVEPLLVPGCELAAWNAPDEVVLAGVAAAVEATLARLPADTRITRLPVSRPFHSACVDPMLDGFEAAVAAVPTRAPHHPLVSLSTGQLASEVLRTPRFWRDHARRPVRCVEASAALGALGCDVFVDLGPSPVLASLVRRNLGGDPARSLATARRDGDAVRRFAQVLADLWVLGVDVDPTGLDEVARPRVALPSTPFERRPFGLPRPEASIEAAPAFVVAWVPAPASAALPPRVRVLGDAAEPYATALRAAGVVVADDAPVTVDLRLHGAPLTALRRLQDVGGERWVVVLPTAADPDAAALRAAARAVRLERPGTRVDVACVDHPGDLVVALATGLDEVRVREGTAEAPRLRPHTPAGLAADGSGTWLVTGGTGSLGMRFAALLASRGATRLVLAARTPLAADDPRRATLAALPCPVDVEAVDLADEAAVRALDERYGFDGVVHAAGVTEPQALDALDDETVARTLRGKVDGARVLDRVLGDRPLRGFVLVGSIAAVWGSRDLVAYAAANGWLDGLAQQRRARGLAGQCLAFGPWGGGGMVDDARAAALARAGLTLLEPRGAMHTVAALLAGPPTVVVVRADWERLVPSLEVGGVQSLFTELVRPPEPPPTAVEAPSEPLETRLLRHARAVLGLGADRVLAQDQPLADLGFDSLMATELKQRLLREGVDLPLGRILSGPSVAEMVEMAAARQAPPAASEVVAAGPDTLWWWTHLAALVVGLALASGVWALFR